MLTSTLSSVALFVMVLAPGVLPAPTKKYPTKKYKSTKGNKPCSGKGCHRSVTTGFESPVTLPPPQFQPSTPWVPPSPVVFPPALPPPQVQPPNPWFRPGQENVTITFGKPQRPPPLGKEGAKKENAPTTPACPGTEEKCKSKGHKCHKHKWHSDEDDDSDSDSDSDDDGDDENHHWLVSPPPSRCHVLAFPRK